MGLQMAGGMVAGFAAGTLRGTIFTERRSISIPVGFVAVVVAELVSCVLRPPAPLLRWLQVVVLQAAYSAAIARRMADRGAGRYYSIVLMTDGENRNGKSFADFERWYRGLRPADQGIRIFPILFGEAKPAELEALAQLSGGRVFDGRKSDSLAAVFKEIRSYQ